MIRYDPLWKTLKARGVSQYKLLKDYHFSAGQLSRLRKNENVSTYTLNTLCSILNCRIEDVAVYRPDTTTDAPEDTPKTEVSDVSAPASAPSSETSGKISASSSPDAKR